MHATRAVHAHVYVFVRVYVDVSDALCADLLLTGERKPNGGMKQGCPLSCTAFVLCLDPPFRRHMFQVTYASSRLCAFVDDVGIALLNLRDELLAEWEAASALCLNTRRWVTVWNRRTAEAMVRSWPLHCDMKVMRSAKELRVRLVPGASTNQWGEVVAKVRNSAGHSRSCRQFFDSDSQFQCLRCES